VALAREHLADLADAALAIGSRLAPILDVLERRSAAPDLFGDAAVGDTLAEADEHGGGPGRGIWSEY
jgi:hypothetical protein